MTIPAVQCYTFTLRQLLAAVAGAAVFSAVLAWALKVNLLVKSVVTDGEREI